MVATVCKVAIIILPYTSCVTRHHLLPHLIESQRVHSYVIYTVVLSITVPYSHVSPYRSNKHHRSMSHTRPKRYYTTHVSAYTCNMI